MVFKFQKATQLVNKNSSVLKLHEKKCYTVFSLQILDLLEKTVCELGLENMPGRIWNLDESSFCIDPSKTKIVGKRGAPATRTTSGPGKENTTVLMCCSASGEKAPPHCVQREKCLGSMGRSSWKRISKYIICTNTKGLDGNPCV